MNDNNTSAHSLCVTIYTATDSQPFTIGRTHSPAPGLGKLEECSDDDGMYFATFTTEQLTAMAAEQDGWSWRNAPEFFDSRGELGVWKDFGGNIRVGVSVEEIEELLDPNSDED